MADHDENESSVASDAVLPPPPPPPPQTRPDDRESKLKKRRTPSPDPTLKPQKRKDFREILTLFHDETMDIDRIKNMWSSLYQTTYMESQEDYRKQQQQEQHGRKRKKSGEPDHGPLSSRGQGALARHGNLSQDHLKRARQGSTMSLDSSESGKTSRLGNRFPKNITKASKLLQKFGGRT